MGTTVDVTGSRQGWSPTYSPPRRRLRATLAVLATAAGLLTADLSVATAYGEPPVLTYECSPAPTDCTGWYRGSVTVKWGWFTGSAVYFAGDCLPNPDPWVTFVADTAGFKTSCEVKDADSDDRTLRTVVLHIDKTPPNVAAVTARPPDSGGWFNHPVSVSFQGSDATSGVASCSSTAYAGPDGAGMVVGGSCQDVAGNVGNGSFTLNYDTTPPRPPSVDAMPGDHKVKLSWTTSPDSWSEVVRLARNQPPALAYQGPGNAFTDRSLRNERRYRYVVTLIDPAGNRAAGETSTIPTASSLLLPLPGERVEVTSQNASLPLLVWKPVRGARYYNVQVLREGRKLLSTWPGRPRRRLERRWTYLGKQHQLTEGRYCWHVWPGYGNRSDHRYGKRLGRSCFRVIR
jgi:hypothetical protein